MHCMGFRYKASQEWRFPDTSPNITVAFFRVSECGDYTGKAGGTTARGLVPKACPTHWTPAVRVRSKNLIFNSVSPFDWRSVYWPHWIYGILVLLFLLHDCYQCQFCPLLPVWRLTAVCIIIQIQLYLTENTACCEDRPVMLCMEIVAVCRC
jgi:hypothetical protein